MTDRPEALAGRSNADTAAALLAEIDQALGGSRWSLRPDTEGGIRRLYIAASLRHTAALLGDIVANADREADMAVRILGRSMFEAASWTLYLQLGGIEALHRMKDAHQLELIRWQRDIRDHNAPHRAARKSNRKIAKKNAQIALYNDAHPESPKPLRDLVDLPASPEFELDLSPLIEQTEEEPRGIDVGEIVDLVDGLFADQNPASDQSFAYSYQLLYRGNSNIGAHTNLLVVDYYITGSDRLLAKTVATPAVPGRMHATTEYVSIILLATVAANVLDEEFEREALPVATSVLTTAQSFLDSLRPT